MTRSRKTRPKSGLRIREALRPIIVSNRMTIIEAETVTGKNLKARATVVATSQLY